MYNKTTNNMSTIHTAMTGKTDSLIDAVRERDGKGDSYRKVMSSMANLDQQISERMQRLYEIKNELNNKEDHIVAPPIWCAVDHNNIHHPDYMRMVVHQMD